MEELIKYNEELKSKTFNEKEKDEIDFWMREIEVVDRDNNIIKHKVFDFFKIWNDPVGLFILISARGEAGKSFGSQTLAKVLQHNNLKTVWIKNLETQILLDAKKWLSNPKRIYPEYFGEDEGKHDGIYHDGERYVYFHSLNGASKSKGARDNNVGLIVVDEFNEGTKNLRGDQSVMIDTITQTYNDAVNPWNSNLKKQILLGNNGALSSKYLLDLGVFAIEKGVNNIMSVDGKQIIGRILCVDYEGKKDEIDARLSGNTFYEIAKKTGTAEHSYFNKNIFDEINKVVELDADDFEESLNVIFHINNGYDYFIYVFTTNEGKRHLMGTQLPPNNTNKIFSLRKKDLKEGHYLANNDLKNAWLNIIKKDQISFQNIFTRTAFLDALLK